MTKITDIYELYSFIIYLYGYEYFYSFIYSQPLIYGLFLNISFNLFINYIFKTNIIKFITHSYWKSKLNTIAMPQLLSCTINIINSYDYLPKDYLPNNLIITVPMNLFLNHLISNMYKNELDDSKNIRYLMILLFFIIDII